MQGLEHRNSAAGYRLRPRRPTEILMKNYLVAITQPFSAAKAKEKDSFLCTELACFIQFWIQISYNKECLPQSRYFKFCMQFQYTILLLRFIIRKQQTVLTMRFF